jgi:hypothetical protein
MTILIKNLIIAQLVEKFPAFYRTVKFIVFTRPLPWARSISVLILITCVFKIQFNIVPSTARSSKCSLPLRFCDQNFVCISHYSHTCYMLRLSYPPWFYHSNIWWRVYIVIFWHKIIRTLFSDPFCEQWVLSAAKRVIVYLKQNFTA